MSLAKKLEGLKFDTRMADINLKNGSLTQKDLEDRRKDLPDLAANAVNLDFKHEMGVQPQREEHH